MTTDEAFAAVFLFAVLVIGSILFAYEPGEK